MKTQSVAFRLSKLALVIGAMGMAVSSHAVYNLYKKDGLTLDINGQVDVQATKQDYQHNILNDEDGTKWLRSSPFQTRVAKSYTKSSTDKKPRLGQKHGVSYIDFRGSQVLPNDWRVTANIGLGYSDARDMYLNNSSLSFDKKNQGAISIGRQYLHTNYVNRSGTDTPLDIFSSSALRFDYYGIKGLHASTYYSFTGISDVRKDDNSGKKSGFGLSASYRYPLTNNQSLRVAAGYTENKASPAYTALPLTAGGVTSDYGWINNALNQYPEKVRAVAASVEYQAGPFLVATDVGHKKEFMSDDKRTPLDTKGSDYLGAKVAYDINPVTQLSAGYGVKKTDSKLKTGTNALTLTQAGSSSYVDGEEIHLFDKANTKELYAQLDYRIRPNVRLYTRYDREKTTFEVAGKDYAEIKDNNIRAGVVFSF